MELRMRLQKVAWEIGGIILAIGGILGFFIFGKSGNLLPTGIALVVALSGVALMVFRSDT